MIQCQGKQGHLERIPEVADTKRSDRGGKRLDPEQGSPWRKRILTSLGVAAELAAVLQLVLAFAPAGGAADQNVDTGGGDAAWIEQHITIGDGSQIYAQVGDGVEPEPEPEPTLEPTSELALDDLSEEEVARVRGMYGKEQLACASDHYRAGEYRKAEQVLEILLEDEGHSQSLKAGAHYDLGLARYRQGKPALARQAFDDSTKAVGSAKAYYCLGIVNYDLGEYEQAIRAYDQALLYETGNTDKVDVYLARAAAYERWKDAPEGKALEDYESALELAPEDPTALAGVGRLGDSER